MKKTKVIVALDGLSEKDCCEMSSNLLRAPYLAHHQEYLWGFKLSPEQYLSFSDLRSFLKGRIFVDRKFDDIPNRVKTDFDFYKDVQILSFHLGPNEETIKRAVEWGRKNNVLVVGVLLLSSISQKEAIANLGLTREMIVYGKAVRAAILDVAALVVSLPEMKHIEKIYASHNKNVLIIAPGIRPNDCLVQDDDQKITATPSKAMQYGADFLIIGRPIVQADNPIEALKRIIEEIKEVEEDRERFRRKQYYG